MYTSVALSTFTMLCNYHHHPPPELFIIQKWNSVPIKHWLSLSPSSRLWKPLYLLFLWFWVLYVLKKWTHTYLSLCDRLITFSMFSRFIHVVSSVSTYLFMAECFIICIYHILFILSFINGYLGCFHLWAIVKMLL